MCLIIDTKKDIHFTDEEVLDFYKSNRDGIGLMYVENGMLYYNKIVPHNAHHALQFWRDNVDGRDCTVHFRMKTHGAIDLANAHPYPVFGDYEEVEPEWRDMPPLLLIHNGVLHTPQNIDVTKSDTWHYIRTFLRPILKADPSLIHDPAFKAVFEQHIGSSNRFVLMDGTGVPVILNKHTGLHYKGAWFANRYAWSASKYVPLTYDTGSYRGYQGSLYSGDYGSSRRTALTVHSGGKERDDSAAFDKWLQSREPFNGGNAKATTTKKRKAKKDVVAKIRGRKNGQAGTGKAHEPVVTPAVRPSDFGWVTRKEPVVQDSRGKSFVQTSSGLVSMEWVDDVREIREQLDAVYPDNMTRDSEIEDLLRTLGEESVYKFLEAMWSQVASGKNWDQLVKYREQRRTLCHFIERRMTELTSDVVDAVDVSEDNTPEDAHVPSH